MKQYFRLASVLFGGQKSKTPVGAGVHEGNVYGGLPVSTSVSTNGRGSNQFYLLPEYEESGKTSFAKHLRFKLGSKHSAAEYMVVTPAMAEEMLVYNEDNRPLSATTVKKYARYIKSRQWGVDGNGTSEPVIFSDRPRLLSGQHRLAAIREAGVPQRMLVVFGEPDGNFAYIDQGRRRTAGDVFSINGVPNHVMAAAAVRFLMAYENGRNSSDDGGVVDATNQEAYEAYLRFEGLQESIKIGLKFAKDRLPAPAICAAVHYLCAQKSRKAADEFFMKVASGVGFTSAKDPAKKVRDFLTRGDVGRITRKMTAAVLIEGWNAMRTNKTPPTLKADAIRAVI